MTNVTSPAPKPSRTHGVAASMTAAEVMREPVKSTRDRSLPDCLLIERHVNERAPLWRGAFPSYGGTAGAFGPLAGTPRRVDRVIEVTTIAADCAVKELDSSFHIEVDRDHNDTLTGVAFSCPSTGVILRMALSGRFLEFVGHPPIGLSWKDAGSKLIAVLAKEAGILMGSPVRTVN